jgi:hypothetical protein
MYITLFNRFVLLLVSIMFNLPSVGCIWSYFHADSVSIFIYCFTVSGRAFYIQTKKNLWWCFALESSTFINQPVRLIWKHWPGSEEVCNWQKLEINVASARNRIQENFLEMYRMNWKLHYFTVQDIYPLCWTGLWMIKWFAKYKSVLIKRWSD